MRCEECERVALRLLDHRPYGATTCDSGVASALVWLTLGEVSPVTRRAAGACSIRRTGRGPGPAASRASWRGRRAGWRCAMAAAALPPTDAGLASGSASSLPTRVATTTLSSPTACGGRCRGCSGVREDFPIYTAWHRAAGMPHDRPHLRVARCAMPVTRGVVRRGAGGAGSGARGRAAVVAARAAQRSGAATARRALRPDHARPGGAASAAPGGRAASPLVGPVCGRRCRLRGPAGEFVAAGVLLGLAGGAFGVGLAGGDLGECGLRAGDRRSAVSSTVGTRRRCAGSACSVGSGARSRGCPARLGLERRGAAVVVVVPGLSAASGRVELVVVADLAVALGVGLLRAVGGEPLLGGDAVGGVVGVDAAGAQLGARRGGRCRG